jgi:hypothetical protein
MVVAASVLLLLGAGSASARSAPAVSIDDVTVTETNFDIVAVLTATLESPSPGPVTVPYSTADGTADSTDYVADSGTVTFPAGATTVRVPVLIKGDALDEQNETFFVDVDGARGTVTILDDLADRAPLRVLDAAVTARWNVHRSYTRVARLAVTRAPAGAMVEARCTGGGCPFASRQTGLRAGRSFGAARLRPGARIQVWVDAPGSTGRVFEYTIRAAKAPRLRVLCASPEATTPTAC